MSSFAQMAAMAAHANACLSKLIPVPEWRDLGGFQYARKVRFTVGWDLHELGASFPEWIAQLEQLATERVRLFVEPYAGNFEVIQLLGFANAHRWAVETDSPNMQLIWHLRSTVLDRDDPDRRIWEEHYGGFGLKPDQPRMMPTAEEALSDLRAALNGAIVFTTEHGLVDRQRINFGCRCTSTL